MWTFYFPYILRKKKNVFSFACSIGCKKEKKVISDSLTVKSGQGGQFLKYVIHAFVLLGVQGFSQLEMVLAGTWRYNWQGMRHSGPNSDPEASQAGWLLCQGCPWGATKDLWGWRSPERSAWCPRGHVRFPVTELLGVVLYTAWSFVLVFSDYVYFQIAFVVMLWSASIDSHK